MGSEHGIHSILKPYLNSASTVYRLKILQNQVSSLKSTSHHAVCFGHYLQVQGGDLSSVTARLSVQFKVLPFSSVFCALTFEGLQSVLFLFWLLLALGLAAMKFNMYLNWHKDFLF